MQPIHASAMRWLAAGLATVCAFVTVNALAIGPAQLQVKTAAEHASFAAKADSINGVHTHLHHVLNCLVGPKDKDFDASAADPCKGQGHGAINDAKKDTLMTRLDEAKSLAEDGIKQKDLATAQAIARAIDALLSAPPKPL